MPPRVCSTSLPALDAAVCQVARAAAAPSATATTATRSTPCLARNFTTTQSRAKITVARHNMYKWLKRAERDIEGAKGPQYLGPHLDQPFPNNPLFRSQPVLSEYMRELIYDKVVGQGEALKAVSQELQVDVNRVAAVVRLKQVERNMVKEVSLAVIFLFPSLSHPSTQYRVSGGSTTFYVMKLYTNSISLEDIPRGYICAFYLSD
jgi:hypothetical protein